jgi:hypothetical protein
MSRLADQTAGVLPSDAQGAVALSVELLDMKLLFISSHLAAHGDQVQQRNADYQRIKAGLFATPADATPRSGASSGRSPRARRGGSMEIPRIAPTSAPCRVANSDSGSASPGMHASGPGKVDSMSGRTGSAPWAGFLRSNRVMDSSPFEEFGNFGTAAAAHKRVCELAQLPGLQAKISCPEHQGHYCQQQWCQSL